MGCIAGLAALVVVASLASSAAAQPPREFTITSDQQVGEFRLGLRTPGAIVRVTNNVELNQGRRYDIPIAAGVTLVGGRNAREAGPLIYTKTRPPKNHGLFEIQGDDVRIVGVRIRGPDTGDLSRIPRDRKVFGITSDSYRIEIAHSEIYGWAGAAIRLEDDRGLIGPIGNPIVAGAYPTVRIHDNYIHHNQHQGTRGYGVAVVHHAYALIERNVFDYNRHAIAGDGSNDSGYVAVDNLVGPHGGKHRWIPAGLFGVLGVGVWVKTHQFDMHGQRNCGVWSRFLDSLKNCGRAGYDMYIGYNSFLYTGRPSRPSRLLPRAPAIKLRGTPERAETERCGAWVVSNVFEHGSILGARRALRIAVQQTERGLCMRGNNRVNGSRLRRTLRCDVDADGIRDFLMVTGQGWWYWPGPLVVPPRPWVFVRRSTATPRRCPAPGSFFPAPPAQPDLPPAPPPQPPAAGLAPDLVISSMTADQFTVTNQGATAAGPFRVSVVSGSGSHDFDFGGLAVGESQTRSYIRPCGELREARADSLNQVPESSEINNTATHPGPSFC